MVFAAWKAAFILSEGVEGCEAGLSHVFSVALPRGEGAERGMVAGVAVHVPPRAREAGDH